MDPFENIIIIFFPFRKNPILSLDTHHEGSMSFSQKIISSYQIINKN